MVPQLVCRSLWVQGSSSVLFIWIPRCLYASTLLTLSPLMWFSLVLFFKKKRTYLISQAFVHVGFLPSLSNIQLFIFFLLLLSSKMNLLSSYSVQAVSGRSFHLAVLFLVSQALVADSTLWSRIAPDLIRFLNNIANNDREETAALTLQPSHFCLDI